MRRFLFSVGCIIFLILLVWWAGGLPRFARNVAPVVLIPQGTDNGRLFQEHARRVPGGASILLLGAGHQALPAALAFGQAGIPFSVTHDLSDALSHRMVLIPTDDRSLRPGPAVLAQLKDFVQKGGILVLQTPPDLLGPLTGLYAENPRRTRHRLSFRNAVDDGFRYLDEPEETEVHLASQRTPEGPWTHGLMGSSGSSPIAVFPDEKQPAILRRRHGDGAVYTLGFDLKDMTTRPRSRRHFDAGRCLTGEFEPAGDVVSLMLRAWYESGPKPWVRLRSLPGSLRGLVTLTHNIGWGSALDAAVDFAKSEKDKDIQATFFVQTKLSEDFLKGEVYDDRFSKVLQSIVADGHELGSHSVAHGADLHLNALGKPDTPREEYSPKVDANGYTRGGTLLGEMGVSKRLLEKTTGAKVAAFRSAFRRDPDFLDEGLKATGYRWDSSLTACGTLTHFPFFLPHLRSMDLQSGILELPMSWDDENQPEGSLDFSKVLALLKKVSANEAPFVWLVHPSLAPAKKRALDRTLTSLPDGMAVWPLGRTALFWSARHDTRFSYDSPDAGKVRLRIEAPAGRHDLSFEFSGPVSSCSLAPGSRRSGVEVSCSGRLAILKGTDGAPVELLVDMLAPGDGVRR